MKMSFKQTTAQRPSTQRSVCCIMNENADTAFAMPTGIVIFFVAERCHEIVFILEVIVVVVHANLCIVSCSYEERQYC
jgi:dihydroxyacetone kinase-like predicted kinase